MKTLSILLLLLLSMLTISLEVPVMARTPQAELSQIQSTNILVTHIKGGNLFLYRQPTTIHQLSPGSITGGVGVPSTNLKPPLINHANFWSPAWIYKIDSLQPQQVISLSVEGSGVRVEIIHPNCISSQKPGGFLAVGPSGCRTWSSTSNENFNGKETYVHLKADSSAMPGQRKLSVKYKTTIGLKKQTWEFTRTFTVYVARSGKAQLINATYLTSTPVCL